MVLGGVTPGGHPVMDMLAQATGGHAFKNTNDVRGAIRTVLDDSDATYTLAFHVDEGGLDSKFHKIKVNVHRAGAEARHRDGYEATPESPADDKHRAAEIRSAVDSPLDAGGVRLRVELTRGEKLKFSVVVTAEDVTLETKAGRSTGLIDAVFAQRSVDGRDLGTAFYTLRPDLDAKQRADASKNGLGFTKEIAPAKDATEVKVVIVDRETGRLGSVIVPLRK
jgi:hypothetical protein